MCRPAPTSLAAFDEANRLWPTRSRASDGACPGGRHHIRNPSSDHEPDPRLNDWSCAFDLTHDPAHGVDTFALADMLKNDPRVKYVVRSAGNHDEIFNNEMGDRYFRAMSKHDHGNHLHVSLHHRIEVLTDTRPWFSKTLPVVPVEEDDLTPDQMQLVLISFWKNLFETQSEPWITLRQDFRYQVVKAIEEERK